MRGRDFWVHWFNCKERRGDKLGWRKINEILEKCVTEVNRNKQPWWHRHTWTARHSSFPADTLATCHVNLGVSINHNNNSSSSCSISNSRDEEDHCLIHRHHRRRHQRLPVEKRDRDSAISIHRTYSLRATRYRVPEPVPILGAPLRRWVSRKKLEIKLFRWFARSRGRKKKEDTQISSVLWGKNFR